MKTQISEKWLGIMSVVGRVAIGIIFLITGYFKVRPLPGFPWSVASVKISLAMFGTAVDSYQILPPWGVSLMAHFLPFVELALGILLLAGLALRFSTLLSAIAVLTFFTAQLSAYLRNMEIPCGCGLIPGEQIGPLSLTIDALLLLLCLALTFSAFRERSDKPAQRVGLS